MSYYFTLRLVSFGNAYLNGHIPSFLEEHPFFPKMVPVPFIDAGKITNMTPQSWWESLRFKGAIRLAWINSSSPRVLVKYLNKIETWQLLENNIEKTELIYQYYLKHFLEIPEPDRKSILHHLARQAQPLERTIDKMIQIPFSTEQDLSQMKNEISQFLNEILSSEYANQWKTHFREALYCLEKPSLFQLDEEKSILPFHGYSTLAFSLLSCLERMKDADHKEGWVELMASSYGTEAILNDFYRFTQKGLEIIVNAFYPNSTYKNLERTN